MDVQELTSCILQFSTATIFDEIKLQSSVLGKQGPNTVTQVSSKIFLPNYADINGTVFTFSLSISSLKFSDWTPKVKRAPDMPTLLGKGILYLIEVQFNHTDELISANWLYQARQKRLIS